MLFVNEDILYFISDEIPIRGLRLWKK